MTHPRVSSGWTLSGASLKERALLTVSSLAALGMMYWVYSLAVAPLLKGPPLKDWNRKLDQNLPAAGTSPAQEMAQRYLAHLPWVADAKYLGSPESESSAESEFFIYFQSWEQDEENKKAIRLKPFALIWLPKGAKEGDPPYTVASESAYVTFENEIEKGEILNRNHGRVEGGGLEGSVQITGPDDLSVWGRNFVFDVNANKIWSDNTVDFAYRKSRGNALGLQIDFVPGEKTEKNSALNVSGIKSVRLRRNVVLDLVSERPEQSGQFGLARKSDKKSKGPEVAQVRCDGSFEYVLETNVATLEDNVRIIRPTGPGQFDKVLSDETVELTFDRQPDQPTDKPVPADGAPPRPDPAREGSTITPVSATANNVPSSPRRRPDDGPDRFRGFDSQVSFRKLHARGNSVILSSQSNKLWARGMTDLQYNAVSRTASLASHAKPAAQETVSQVLVEQRSSKMRSPEITLLHDEKGAITHAWCRGPGRLDSYDEKTGRILELSAEWKKGLRKYPDAKSPFDIIELNEQALIQQPEQQWGLAAEHIRIWTDPVQRTKKKKPRDPAARSAARSERTRLRYMLARQNVALVNPEMQAQTEKLEVWFEDRPAAPNPSIGNLNRRSRAKLVPTAGRENRAPRSGDGPIELESNLIQVRVLQGSGRNDTEVAEIWTKGNVRVRQEHGPKEEPTRMFGDEMHVENRSQTQKVLHLFGRPAHIHDRGVYIEGNDVLFDRAGNEARVQGVGRLQLPVSQSFDGKPLPQPLPLDIFWKEQMTFDGLSARFFGNVQSKMDDERTKNEVRCQEMQVVLTERLDFSGRDRRQDVRVRNILCDGGVEFESDEFEAGRCVDIRRVRSAQFQLDQMTGDTRAQGPGLISRWQYGQERPSGLGPLSTARANAPVKPKTSEWTYTRVQFAGQMTGNMNQRSSTFHDDVDILYGPVAKEMQTLDRDKLAEDAGWLGCDALTVTQHPETDQDPAYAVLEAVGNARLEGRSDITKYYGQSDIISYDGFKGQFMLLANGNNSAKISRQRQRGGAYEQQAAHRIEFYPRTGKTNVHNVTGLNGTQ